MSQERTFEIVNGWLVERCEGDPIDGYGILPGSDLVPHMDLSQIRGWMFSDEAIERAVVAMWNHDFPSHPINDVSELLEWTRERRLEQARVVVAALKGDA